MRGWIDTELQKKLFATRFSFVRPSSLTRYSSFTLDLHLDDEQEDIVSCVSGTLARL